MKQATNQSYQGKTRNIILARWVFLLMSRQIEASLI